MLSNILLHTDCFFEPNLSNDEQLLALNSEILRILHLLSKHFHVGWREVEDSQCPTHCSLRAVIGLNGFVNWSAWTGWWRFFPVFHSNFSEYCTFCGNTFKWGWRCSLYSVLGCLLLWVKFVCPWTMDYGFMTWKSSATAKYCTLLRETFRFGWGLEVHVVIVILVILQEVETTELTMRVK